MNNETTEIKTVKVKEVSETEELIIEVKRLLIHYWRYEIIFTVGLLIGWLI